MADPSKMLRVLDLLCPVCDHRWLNAQRVAWALMTPDAVVEVHWIRRDGTREEIGRLRQGKDAEGGILSAPRILNCRRGHELVADPKHLRRAFSKAALVKIGGALRGEPVFLRSVSAPQRQARHSTATRSGSK